MVIISTNLEKTIIIVEMCQNVPEEIKKRGNLLPMKSKSAYEKVYVSFQGRNNGGNGRCHFGFS
jgi:hypothetical protein